MLLSTNQELRLHIPSNAVDDVTLLSGIIDNSEKDFLRDKLGNELYDALCEYYDSIDPLEFYNNVVNGTYTADHWAELLLNAQRMITNDALARFAYQQVISVNGSGVNVVSGNDYGNADDRLLDKGVGGYKKEAAIACNNLLILLEDWAMQPEPSDELKKIVESWKKSKYYYHHGDLLIPTASILQQYLDIYENRDKFIRLLPDLRFIQDEYIEDAFGEDFVKQLLNGKAEDAKMLRKVRRLMTSYLEQRTTVLTIDKTRRLQAHDESISLKAAILKSIQESQSEASGPDPASTTDEVAYQNNREGSKIFVSPLLM